jgi:pantoate kinase
MQIKQTTMLSRNNQLLAAQVDDELVMLDSEQGKYFSLNKVGAVIWALLEEAMTYQELLSSLMKQFTVEQQQCQQDVEPFLEKMLQAKLVVASE